MKVVIKCALLLVIGITVFWQCSNKTVSIPGSDFDIAYGADSADFTIVMFSSYQCKYCKKFLQNDLNKLINDLNQEYTIRFVIKNVEPAQNKQVIESLKLAACINKYGYIESLDNMLLIEPRVVYTEEFNELIDEFTDKDDNIAECMFQGEADGYLNSSFKLFKEIGFTGTPSFIINNKAVKGYHSFLEIKEILDKELGIIR